MSVCMRALKHLIISPTHTQHKIFSEFATPTRLTLGLNTRELWRSSTTVPGALSATLNGLSTMHWWLVEQLASPLLYVPSRMVPTMGPDRAPCIWTMFDVRGRRLLCSIVCTRPGVMCPAPVTIATMLLLSALTVSTVYFEGINFRGMTVRKDFRRLFLHGMAAFLQHACDIKFVGYKCSRYMCFISENREH